MSAPSTPHHLRRISLLALLLGLGLLLCAVLFVPGAQGMYTRLGLQQNDPRYDEVVRQIRTGTIPGGSPGGGDVTLPAAYQDLSPASQGQALIYQDSASLRVLFYLPGSSPLTRRIYMYASAPPSPADFHGECSGLQELRPGWYLLHCP
jgi:hypothetical protein